MTTAWPFVVAADAFGRHQDGILLDTGGEARADKHSRQQFFVRIGDNGPQGYRSGRLIDRHIRKFKRAGMCIF